MFVDAILGCTVNIIGVLISSANYAFEIPVFPVVYFDEV